MIVSLGTVFNSEGTGKKKKTRKDVAQFSWPLWLDPESGFFQRLREVSLVGLPPGELLCFILAPKSHQIVLRLRRLGPSCEPGPPWCRPRQGACANQQGGTEPYLVEDLQES